MSSDAVVRAGVEGVEVFDFGGTPAATAPSLSEARVAIVTTAGLRPDGQATWTLGQGFVVLDDAARSLTLTRSGQRLLTAAQRTFIDEVGIRIGEALSTSELQRFAATLRTLRNHVHEQREGA